MGVGGAVDPDGVVRALDGVVVEDVLGREGVGEVVGRAAEAGGSGAVVVGEPGHEGSHVECTVEPVGVEGVVLVGGDSLLDVVLAAGVEATEATVHRVGSWVRVEMRCSRTRAWQVGDVVPQPGHQRR